MYYIIYETKNLINNKIYRGCHKTEKLNDGYLGSGKLLVKSIKKHGKKNFERTILVFCNSFEDMLETEKLYVDYDFVLREDTYNLRVGGYGGKMTDEIRNEVSRKLAGVPKSEETKIKMSIAQTGIKRSTEHRNNIAKSAKNRQPPSKETREKYSNAAKSRPNNSIGTIWINDGLKNKRIKNDLPLPLGFVLGRI
jgi:hypothetical protein